MQERLHNARTAGAARNTSLVLVGLCGAGKSKLALNYIYTHREDYSAVFWVDETAGVCGAGLLTDIRGAVSF